MTMTIKKGVQSLRYITNYVRGEEIRPCAVLSEENMDRILVI